MSLQIEKVGILGGTFNPIHIGHLILAENAYSRLGLDKVIIMPTGCSYLKINDDVLAADIRLEMCKLSIEGNDHFEVSDYEIVRQGNTYTYETLEGLNRDNPNSDYYFIIGEDSLYNIETWYEPQRIFNNCTLVVAPRDHIDNSRMFEKRDYLQKTFNARIEILDTPDIDISSHMIRDRIKQGISVRYYISDKVNDFIINNKLYK